MNYGKCSSPTKGSIVVVRENKSCFEVLNPNNKRIMKIEVDGCLISERLEKCDWIISLEQPIKRAMYIELKGCGIDKAISQLQSTLQHTRVKFNDYQKECYAVTTRIPKHGSTNRKKCIDFHKKTNVTLKIKNLKSTVTA